MKLFRDYAGRWVLMVRLPHRVKNWFHCARIGAFARIGTDCGWYKFVLRGKA